MDLPTQNNLIEKLSLFLLIGLIPILRTDKTLDPNLNLQYISLTILLIGFWFVISFKKKELIIRNNTVIFILIIYFIFILYSIISVIISRNAADAIFFFTKYILFFVLLISFLFFINSTNIFRTVSRSAILLSLVSSIPAYYQLVDLIKTKELIIPLSTYSLFSVFPHRNLFAEILLFTVPFSVYTFFNDRHYWKYLGSISYSLALFMLIILSNRASWLGLSMIGIIAIIILFIKKQVLDFNRPRILFIISTFLVVLISLLFLSYYSDAKSLRSHALNTLDFTQGSTKDRIELWSRTINIISEKPIFGGGLGSWKIEILKYGNENLVSENNTTFYQRPHNDLLWMAAEQGIIGCLLYLLLFAFILTSLLKTILNNKDRLLTSQMLVILSITLSFIIFSLFSFPKERISHNILLFVSWGLFLNRMNSRSDQRTEKAINSNYAFYFPIFILIIILIIGINRINGEIHTKRAIIAKKNAEFQKCIQEIDNAESFFYKMDETSTPLNWYSGLSYFKLTNYRKAADQFEIALHINPYHIYTLNDYASSLYKLGQNDMAIEFYNKAIAIAPNFLEPTLNLCAIYYNEGKYIAAFNLLKSTDIENTTDRYQKTVILIIRKLIDEEIKNTQQSMEFMHLYQEEFHNFNFYKELLLNAKKYDLQANEISNHYKINKNQSYK